MIIHDKGMRWSLIHARIDEPLVRRYAVPNGWLYQVSVEPLRRAPCDEKTSIETLVNAPADGPLRAWHPPVFIPDETSPG